MSKSVVVGRNAAPRRVVLLNRLRVLRSLIEIASTGRHGVKRLRHSAPASGHDHRVLHDVACFEIDINTLLIFTFAITSDALEEWNARALSIAHTNTHQILTSERLVLRLATLGRRASCNRGCRTRSKQRRLLL